MALKSLYGGLIPHTIRVSPSTSFDMFDVRAPTHSSTNDGIGPEFVSNAHLQFQHGVCLYNGIGVQQNFEMAAYYFKLSADQGLAEGQYRYGICLHKGDGVQRNFEMAAYYFKLSADQGHALGQFKYGF
jgi:TPR repeat protein